MAGNKKPTKAYKPKQRFQNPLQYATENQMLLIDYDRNYVTEIKIRHHSAMTALLAGQASKHDVDVIAAGYNMVCGMASIMKFPKEVDLQFKDLLARASLAFKDLCLRANKIGKPIAKAIELNTLNELTDTLDELLGVVSVRQFEQGVKYALTQGRRNPKAKEEQLEIA